jgi:putative ABC transport system permease protein
MLFRRKGTGVNILAIALLIALVAAVTSLVNNVNSQTTALTQIANKGKTYIAMDATADSVIDSKVDPAVVALLQSRTDIEAVAAQTFLQATLHTSSGTHSVILCGVQSPETFLKTLNANINGTYAANQTQINVGEILANLYNCSLGEEISLAVDNRIVNVTITGIVRTSTQVDSEIVLPPSVFDALSARNCSVSIVGFTPKNADDADVLIASLSSVLPANVEVVEVQQLAAFAVDVNSQILSFLNLWSVVVYVVVVAASYIVASRLIAEASYELAMIKTLGGKRQFLFQIVLTHTVVVALFGSILGLAIGLAGAQVVSTGVRWVWSSMQVTPFLEASQTLQIISIAFVASIVGCFYPALKATHTTPMESPL